MEVMACLLLPLTVKPPPRLYQPYEAQSCGSTCTNAPCMHVHVYHVDYHDPYSRSSQRSPKTCPGRRLHLRPPHPPVSSSHLRLLFHLHTGSIPYYYPQRSTYSSYGRARLSSRNPPPPDTSLVALTRLSVSSRLILLRQLHNLAPSRASSSSILRLLSSPSFRSHHRPHVVAPGLAPARLSLDSPWIPPPSPLGFAHSSTVLHDSLALLRANRSTKPARPGVVLEPGSRGNHSTLYVP
ncbi:hypothetical protein B0J13DRAFT_331974 [Dactylonectria estremocensis]|uniref:Uncharacterized protein n=1 Tax=Dactylonectria estremocensis TaxID=1079267 RepID=A0A9P9EUN0_9HYPO|nr:hypothetical protein B0J13DRAFT_331974 [Dactylonectria estremocensis]